MSDRIYLSSPHMSGKELEFIQEAFDTNWISPVGPHISGFEKELSEYIGIPHVAALSSGTAGIHLALINLRVGRGDHVICSSFTFAASAYPVSYLGATPVFVDSDSDTWNMDPVLLEQAIESSLAKGIKPKAIIIVHLYGMPAKMDEICKIAENYEIPIVEDAAEALGAHYKGKKLGNFGEMSILSFNGNKIITTSGGGALMSKNEEYISKARFLATQARDPAPHYQHSEVGFNYRMSNICAGIGRGQLQVIEDRVHTRRENHSFYERNLGNKPGFSFLEEPDGFFSNRWLTCIQIDPSAAGIDRETLRLGLEEKNIETRPLWKPMHQQPLFEDCMIFSEGVSDKLFENGLCLPSGSNLTKSDLERIMEEVLRLIP